MGNVILAWGQVREKLNAIIAGVQWIEKETVAPNSIPINLQNMNYLAAGVRRVLFAFCAGLSRSERSGVYSTANTDTCSRGFLITIGGVGRGGGHCIAASDTRQPSVQSRIWTRIVLEMSHNTSVT